MLMKPRLLSPGIVQPFGALPANTLSPTLRKLWRTFNSIAVSCAESIYAMLTAFALSSQLWSCVLVVGSKLLPLALRRLRPARKLRSAAVSSFWPFLFDQKPSVWPPVPPRQTSPKLQVLVPPAQAASSAKLMLLQEVGVVAAVFAGLTSLTE